MKKRILLIALIGLSFGIEAQEKIQTDGGFKDDFIYKEGRIGIGTDAPDAPLSVVGYVTIGKGPGIAYSKLVFKPGESIPNYNGTFEIYPTTIPGTGISKQLTYFKSSYKVTGGQTRHDIAIEGNVGIGTTNLGIWKLAVNGKIRAKEIKVETGWSDFVFKNDYKLPTLKEVENHIKEKGHLKDIPSAKEVEKNGIFLGEMDSKLLQKIEELTLYTIQQEKRLNSLELKNEKLEKENNSIKMVNTKLLELQLRLEKLEKK